MINSIELLRRGRPEEPPACDGSGDRVEVPADSGSYATVACGTCQQPFRGRTRRTYLGKPLHMPVVRVPRHAPAATS